MTTLNLSLAAIIFILALHSNSYGTPLDDYVYAPDDHYSYKEIESFRGSDYTVYIYNMTSQKWKDESILDHPVWWHYLTITIPDKVIFDSAFLFIDGGYNDDRAPSITDTYVAFTATFASGTGAIAAELRMIPNQPIVFNVLHYMMLLSVVLILCAYHALVIRKKMSRVRHRTDKGIPSTRSFPRHHDSNKRHTNV